VVARNGERLSSLVDDLLDTAWVNGGSMEVLRDRHDLSEIVRASVEAATPAAVGAGVELELDAPPTLTALIDAGRIAQAVDNLISNAIKYTPSGGRVEVRLGVDGARIEICVADSGIGIRAGDRNQLFTRFFRARHAEEQSVQGVGLGLSIASRSWRATAGGSRSTARSVAAARSGSGCRARADPRSRPSGATRPESPQRQRQEPQIPKISRVWLTSAYPCSSAIARVHRSTVGPSTSTVAPHPRQTRWWW
jgi:signal transduction histidine kinase